MRTSVNGLVMGNGDDEMLDGLLDAQPCRSKKIVNPLNQNAAETTSVI
jgi:hypothetical protein